MTRNKRPLKLLQFEQILIKICILMILLFPVLNVFSKANLSKVNIEVERLRRNINNIEDRNQSLAMRVNQLKSFDNIQIFIEQEGLAYDNSNIKVIGED